MGAYDKYPVAKLKEMLLEKDGLILDLKLEKYSCEKEIKNYQKTIKKYEKKFEEFVKNEKEAKEKISSLKTEVLKYKLKEWIEWR